MFKISKLFRNPIFFLFKVPLDIVKMAALCVKMAKACVKKEEVCVKMDNYGDIETAQNQAISEVLGAKEISEHSINILYNIFEQWEHDSHAGTKDRALYFLNPIDKAYMWMGVD